MVVNYWHTLLTEKNWKVLQRIKKEFDFILIGGWAIYLYSRMHKSKGIDIIVDEKLRKYEIKVDEIDIDIYVPFYSRLTIPAEELIKHVLPFRVLRLCSPNIFLH
jgi:hypothetical protein